MMELSLRGHVEVICGPMFSGKTEELIKRLRRAQIARQRVLVVKPIIDNRYAKDDVVSHSSLRIGSIPVASSAEIEPLVYSGAGRVAVVGVDEAQFFDDGIVDVVERLAQNNIRVVVAGLDQDFRGRPFGPMPQLMCLAEMITKQLSVCMVCGAPASKSQRTHPDPSVVDRVGDRAGDQSGQDTVLVGGGENYEARCRGCYVPGLDVPSAAR